MKLTVRAVEGRTQRVQAGSTQPRYLDAAVTCTDVLGQELTYFTNLSNAPEIGAQVEVEVTA